MANIFLCGNIFCHNIKKMSKLYLLDWFVSVILKACVVFYSWQAMAKAKTTREILFLKPVQQVPSAHHRMA